MNMNSFDQELQQMNAPLPDPAARLRARRAALAEFRNVHAQEERQPAASKWSWKSPWLGGFATACVAVVGVSIFWLVPEEQRKIQLPATAPAASEVAPASTAAPQAQIPEPPPVQAPAQGAPTLTQVDDRRVVSSSSQTDVVDLSIVPSNLLQRMDVVTGGASATYGSGATAGVTNLVLNNREAGGAAPPPPGPPAPPVYGPPAPTAAAATAPPRGGAGAGDELSEVRVEGARIQVPGKYTSANPITSITAEEMRRLGIVNVADALLQLSPQAAATTQAGGGAAGDRSAQFIGNTIANLRALDPTFGSRTLTLVDGRRVVSTAPEGGDRFEHFETNAVKRVADEPESTFSIDVDTVSYSFARRVLNEGRLPAMDAVRVEEMINYFDYAWPAPTSRREPLRPTVTVSDSPWGSGKKLVHIGIKGYELPVRGKPDANLVFLLDVSGSMAPNDRLPLAISSMQLLLDSLKPTDTVAIVVYAGAAGLVLPPTPVRNRGAIERALTSLHSGGSTAGAQGIQLAYQTAQLGFRKDGINRILLATDGDFNVGISNREELKGLVERERANGIYLSVLGFGRGNYRDEVAQTLAQNGNGVAAYIDTLQEARKVLVEEAGASLFTIASDVKIQVEFNPAAVAEYRLVGYETRALKREDFNNDKVDAGDVGSGHAVTAIYEITPVGSAAQLIDERRYAASEKPKVAAQGKANEYGFLKIRYKLPGESQSRLMEQPIRQDMGVPAAVRQDVAFSTAVAGFGQLLRGGRYTGALSYDDVIRQAEAARGEDEFGYRAEFVQLARKARAVRSPMCDIIQELDARIVEERRQVTQQLQRFNEQHPEVLAARARVAGTEATRAAEVARAASLGVACQAGALF
jgi:secreted protein with Ig-like and vWFA domain